jgi:hypothetical protein
MADFVAAPSETVKRKFSASVSTSGGGDTTAPAIPGVGLADVAQQPVPQTGPSQADIASFFQPLLDQVQNERAPLSRPVPAETSPTGTFLGLLAGNLATTFSKNPAFAEQSQRYLAEQERKRQAISEQNYADELTFSKEKKNRLIVIRGQILETQLEKAIKEGDQERALVISTNMAKLQEGLQRESQKQKAEQEKALIGARGAEDRKTNAAQAKIKMEEEKAAAGKPLTTKEYLAARNAVARNKELDEKTRSKWKAFGIPLPFGPRDATPTEREEEAEGIDVATIKNGEPTAQRAAKANLKRSILKRLGLLGTTASPEAKMLVRAELEKYGLTTADLR